MSTTIRHLHPSDQSVFNIKLDATRGYFSVTADWPSQREGGCLHADVLQCMPELSPLVSLHLSDLDSGVPMHAEANGYYFACGAALAGHPAATGTGYSPELCGKYLQTTLRIDSKEALRLVDQIRRMGDNKPARAWFAAQVEATRPRWAAEAAAGRALLAHFAAL